MDPVDRLNAIHATLNMEHGSLDDEYPEQLMLVRYVRPDATVLELGGNVGRSSCVIASILDDSSRLVVFESDPATAAQLKDNRDANGFAFHIEAAALSREPLIQCGWDTVPWHGGVDVPEGWTPVTTREWRQTLDTYESLRFNTLVADCEGALFYILRDHPGFLDGFETVVLENDFHQLEHKIYVDIMMARHGLRVAHSEAGGWGPCHDRFYEVWVKAT